MKKSFGKLFKSETIKYRLFSLNPITVMLLCEMATWASDNGMPFLVTETFTTYEEDKRLSRVSPSHREGRAFDVSTRDWTEEKIKKFMDYFGTKYAKIAALAGNPVKPQLIVRHDTGAGDHFHVQINKVFAVAEEISNGGLT